MAILPTINSPVYNSPLQVEANTVIRAVEEVGGALWESSSTVTYIFPEAVLYQPNCIEGYPEKWGPYATIADTAIADYGMDPDLPNNNYRRQRVIDSFNDIPIVSLVSDIDNFFGKSEDPDKGGIYIYTGSPLGNGQGRGWERPVCLELFGGPQGHDLETTCAIKIHGGHSRLPEKNPKHSFRLKFKGEYGPTKLNYPIFGGDNDAEYNSLVLRCFFNNSWTSWGSGARAQYTRDMWARATQHELGEENVKGLYVHVFINGIYWGIYNIAEHIDEHFAKTHFGGKKSDMDIIKVEEMENEAIIASYGDIIAYDELLALSENAYQNDIYYRIEGKDSNGNESSLYEPLLNTDTFIDYMLINQYAGNIDWDYHNWYAVRKRGGDGFHFICWDTEYIMEDVNDNNLINNYDRCPSRIFQGLMKNEIFRKKYLDRAKNQLESDGILSETRVVAVWDSLYHIIDNAIFAEAARWGDYRHNVHSYRVEQPVFDVENTYMTERRRLIDSYFPKRSNYLMELINKQDWFSVYNNINKQNDN